MIAPRAAQSASLSLHAGVDQLHSLTLHDITAAAIGYLHVCIHIRHAQSGFALYNH